jgi:2,3-bisphosphoglycerate-independent phosphoglycerate mutase
MPKLKRKKHSKRKISARRPTKSAVKKTRKKIVFIVVDGMADLPVGSNGGKTPLSAARKPNIEWLVKNGVCGELLIMEKKVWDKHIVAGSHLCNIGLLGYNIKDTYAQRGPLEAVGADIPYHEGHLAIRCNFSTADKDLVVLDRRAGRNTTGLDELAKYINTHVDLGVPFIFKRTFEHRAVLIIKEKLSDKITTNDPFVEGKRATYIQALSPEANRAASLVEDFVEKSRNIIEYHPINEQRISNGIRPANYIIARQAGNRLPPLKQKFAHSHKLKAVVIAENGVMKSTCMLAGFDSITVPEMKPEMTLKFIFENISDALADYDFVYAHIKGVDEYAHDGDFFGKQQAIEKFDNFLASFKNFDGILIITCDHITSTINRRHEWGPVPVLIYGCGKDRVSKFDEFSVKKGKLKQMTPTKFWRFVFRK